jgi:flagellar biosynthesis/type III secretory pathway chaperone
VTLNAAPAAALAAAVRSERAGAQALLQALAEERQLLGRGDTDRLTHMAVHKRELLLHMAQLGDYRNRLLQKASVSPDRRGMQVLLETVAGTDELRNEWRQLLELTEQAQRLNKENGAFIEAGMLANQQALSVLVSAASGATYGPGGRTSSAVSSRTLASA